MASEARVDKWLWAARIYKTRSIAADACKNGRITVNGANVKPSHMVKAGETVSVRKSPVTYSFRILQAIEQRVGRNSCRRSMKTSLRPTSTSCLR